MAETAQAQAEPVVRYAMPDPHVALITLDRPEKRNAVNRALAREMDACVKRTEADDMVRVVVLASSSDIAFCAGADLAEVAAGHGPALFTPDNGFGGFVAARRRKPWIAAVAGAVVAGGMEFCLACDMIVAADDSRFGLPEVKRSLIATEGGVTRLAKAIPRAVALEMVATGDPIGARRAYEIGLVNRIVPKDRLLDSALELALAIAANAPLAVYEAIGVVREAATLPDAQGALLARAALERLRGSEDFREGPRAFLEKRAPVWRGA